MIPSYFKIDFFLPIVVHGPRYAAKGYRDFDGIKKMIALQKQKKKFPERCHSLLGASEDTLILL